MDPKIAAMIGISKQMPWLSIIIPNWNGMEILPDCFDSIFSQSSGGYEVILVDNNSSDGSIDLTRKDYPSVKVLESKVNIGYTGACNAAGKIAKGKYLLFLNSDAKLDHDYVKELDDFIKKNSCAKIIASREFSYDGSIFISQNDGVDFLGYGCTYKPGKVHTAPGCAFVIEKRLFSDLGGFDHKMFMYHEEIDICWRAYLMNEEPYNADRCIFFHSTGGSMPAGSIKRRYLGERNNIRSILKNYSYPVLLFILPIYLLVNFGEVVYLLLTGQLKTIKEAYGRAWVDNIKDFRDIRCRHNEIQQKREINDIQYLNSTCFVIGKLQGFFKLGSEVSFDDIQPK